MTTLLAACGETVHPASADLAPEAAGVDAEAGEHELHAFQMLRRLDEIFCANFMVFHDLVREEPFDVWIADEGWEVDYFLHENPELKTAPYVWLTDFVGVLPMPAGGEREAFLAADFNRQMVEHVARNPHLRDRSIFIGDPDDIVAEPLGPGLPTIRDWTEEHFDFAGYITGFDPAEIADRDALRAELGYAPGEQVCVVAPGGSGVGVHLLQRVAAAFPEAKRRVPELRMILIAGPRIDAASLPQAEGLETHGYVHELYRQLAACDLAITHGGLSTTMELTAAGRPFLLVPAPRALRAEPPRRPPARPPRGRAPHELRRRRAAGDRRRDRRGDRPRAAIPAGRARRRGPRGSPDRRARGVASARDALTRPRHRVRRRAGG